MQTHFKNMKKRKLIFHKILKRNNETFEIMIQFL